MTLFFHDIPGLDWVPRPAIRYLEHTEEGVSIRALARRNGCHPSTILRQIRRIEARRDDPLVDAVLSKLGADLFPAKTAPKHKAAQNKETGMIQAIPAEATLVPAPSRHELDREALRVLRRLRENGAVLAVAEDMEKAVVVREGEDGDGARTAVVDSMIVQAMALKEWIACAAPGRISRYRITAAGRAELNRLLAASENQARDHIEHGFADAQSAFVYGVEQTPDHAVRRRGRNGLADSPLILLSRRKDRDGQPFLPQKLVAAGERLREDFELAQLGPKVAQNWDRFLTGGGRDGFDPGSKGFGSGYDARGRVERALAFLGPGLSDVALRCCCYLEGLENAEKRMGWSARSGKIVLRIALQRLHLHYSGEAGSDRLIG